MMAATQQYDLFGWDAAEEYGRLGDALTVLADAHPRSLELLIGIREPDRGEVKPGVTGPWAYQVCRDGLYTQRRAEWGGWSSRPANRATWDELDSLIGEDSRVPTIRAWSEGLTAIDAWRDRSRPFELWPDADRWHPSHLAGDHARPGWSTRINAWQLTVQVCRDALARLRPEGESA